MKEICFPFLLFALLSSQAKADLGSCVLYRAKFYLKNGDSFKGCFEISGYDDNATLDENGTNRYCNNKGVSQLLKMKQRLGYDHDVSVLREGKDAHKTIVFKNLYYVRPTPRRKTTNTRLSTYGLVEPSDIVFIDSNDISKVIFWDAEYTKREWLTSEIIVGSKAMVDSIHQQKYWNSFEPSEAALDFEYDNTNYCFYNYNAQINEAELMRLIHLKFSVTDEEALQRFKSKHHIKATANLPPKLQRLFYKEQAQKQQERRRWFWQKGVLILKVRRTC